MAIQTGSPDDDSLTGSVNADTITGDAGNDKLLGREGTISPAADRGVTPYTAGPEMTG